MTNYTVYEYFLPVCGVVVLSCIITCCRYCCFVSSVKAQNSQNVEAHGTTTSSGQRRRVPTISGRQDTMESDLLGYRPPADLPRYFESYDPPPDFYAVVAPFPVEDDPPPAYEEINNISRGQEPVS